MRSKVSLLIAVGFGFALLLSGCGRNEMEQEFAQWLKQHVETVKPLEKEANLAQWEASTTGHAEAYRRYEELRLKLSKIYSDRQDFEQLKRWKESGKVRDPLLARQLTLVYNRYLGNQIDSTLLEQIIRKSTAIEEKFNTFRATLDGRRVPDNEISKILRTETDTARRRKAWEASKQIGEVVASDLLELVRLRNQAAESLGFPNYYVMSLELDELHLGELQKIFDELARLTEEPFRELKAEVDTILAKRYGVSVRELRPWHYQDPFFQEGPQVYEVELDPYYKDHDVKEVARQYYRSIGLDVDDILARSDLYEKEGKEQHAFCTDIDREGDIRVLANLRNDEYWMNTILHELGHGVYDKYIDRSLPYLLRQPAHTFTTEAVAMFFGRLSRNPAWMQAMLGIPEKERERIDETVRKSLRLQQLVFARWCQVMFRFEQALYENPDQDLNALWWDLKERYQLFHRPEGRRKPDWAAKIHFTSAPVYYHNYMLGEMLASQFHFTLADKVLKSAETEPSFANDPRIGQFFVDKVFAPGARYRWDEMIRRATGEALSPRFFVRQFVE